MRLAVARLPRLALVIRKLVARAQPPRRYISLGATTRERPSRDDATRPEMTRAISAEADELFRCRAAPSRCTISRMPRCYSFEAARLQPIATRVIIASFSRAAGRRYKAARHRYGRSLHFMRISSISLRWWPRDFVTKSPSPHAEIATFSENALWRYLASCMYYAEGIHRRIRNCRRETIITPAPSTYFLGRPHRITPHFC